MAERHRLIGIVVRIRWAAVFFLALPAPAAGSMAPVLIGLSLYVLAYNGSTALAHRRSRSPEAQTLIAAVSFGGDLALVLLVLGLLDPDPLATGAALIPFLAVSGAAHFRIPGSVVGGAVATVSHTALVAIQNVRDTGALDLLGTLRQGGVFAAVTVLLVLILAELDQMREEREELGRERALLEAATRQANYDAATGLVSRHRLAALLEGEIAGGKIPVALLAIRIATADVTSTFGYRHLDGLRRAVGERLTKVAAGRTVARLVADDFAVLAPSTGTAPALVLAERVLRALESPFEVDGTEVELAGTIGIATTEHASDAETLIRYAGIAQAVATAQHGGVQLFSSEHDRYDPTALSLLVDLRRALEAGGLAAVFQPKVMLAGGRVIGVEMLARWSHPVRGPVSPGVFIPLAEGSLLRRPLLRWSLDAAADQASAWAGRGRSLPIAVNISPRDLLDSTLTSSLAALLEGHGLRPERLSLEITEGAIMDDPERCIVTLTDLRRLGLRLSIDDFGTGQSSLRYLHRLPVQELKIDRSFVSDLVRSAASRAVVRAAVALAEEMGLEVVAEGVEDQPTADMLTGLGCPAGQGYLYSPPLPGDRLDAWLTTHANSATVRPGD